jgi:hypothetical protein
MKRSLIVCWFLYGFLYAQMAAPTEIPPRYSVHARNRTPDNRAGGNLTYEPGVDIAASGINGSGQKMPRPLFRRPVAITLAMGAGRSKSPTIVTRRTAGAGNRWEARATSERTRSTRIL